MAYDLEGTLLEVCTCNVLCPCWIGEDPDGGVCDGIVGYHVDRGTVDGVDVSGRSFALLAHLPRDVLKGNARARGGRVRRAGRGGGPPGTHVPPRRPAARPPTSARLRSTGRTFPSSASTSTS